MKQRATQLQTSLQDLEHELKVSSEEPISQGLITKADSIVADAELFLSDERERDEADSVKISRRAAQVRTLVRLRKQLADALANDNDDVFEETVRSCQEARIQDSSTVRERLKAIELPRAMIRQLYEAINAPNMDVTTLQKALYAAGEYKPASESSKNRQLEELIANTQTLLEALRNLENAIAKGKKAHAQLLVSTDHDTQHIGKLQQELDAFVALCKIRDADLDEPSIIAVASELVAKWSVEEVSSGFARVVLQKIKR